MILEGLVRESNNKPLSIYEVKGDNSYLKGDLYTDISISKNWLQNGEMIGAQYDGIIHNNSDHDINNWDIEITVPEKSYIDSSWNGVYKKDGTVVKVISAGYNDTIKKRSIDTFGYVMITPEKFEVEKITIRGYKVFHREDFALFWILLAAIFVLVITIFIFVFIEFREYRFKAKQNEYKQIILQSLNTFANLIDAKDSYTKGHSVRVSMYACEIARRMGLTEDEQENISYIALLHDIGKIGITNDLLYKPGPLTQEERFAIQMHPAIGAEILKDFTALPGFREGARFHHERYDGSGYPDGLHGKDIPLCARIICIADSYDAMACDRCYRNKLDEEQILSEFSKCSGTQFDPDLVGYMVEMIEDGFVNEVKEKEG